MQSVNFGAAIVAGVIGTLAMTALMYAAPLMGLPPMDLLSALGSMVPVGVSPYVVGGAIHLAIGVTLALLYAVIFERILPGPRWVRGATFSLLPWLFAITLMGPAMAWLQATVSHADAGTVASPTLQPANPCAIQPRPANPCGAVAPKPANPCAASAQGADMPSPWLLRMMSLMAHLVYGGLMAVVYRSRA